VLTTEDRNPRSSGLDLMSTPQILTLINDEDQTIASLVREELEEIAQAVELLVSRYKAGGRVVYIGAGTSARLAVADAAELGPTYGLSSERILVAVAGGPQSVFQANELAEDRAADAATQLKTLAIDADDVVVGLSASGTTPFVRGGLEYATEKGAGTVLIACNQTTMEADVTVVVPTGPEVVTGSTRMKAATAQRMVLTMLSTTMAVRLGLVYDNLMVAMTSRNAKCQKRALAILREISDEDEQTCHQALEFAQGDLRLAALLLRTRDLESARKLLAQTQGFLRGALGRAEVEKR
jgi:N-acetylmuramic acid 6-phosphate etherase